MPTRPLPAGLRSESERSETRHYTCSQRESLDKNNPSAVNVNQGDGSGNRQIHETLGVVVAVAALVLLVVLQVVSWQLTASLTTAIAFTAAIHKAARKSEQFYLRSQQHQLKSLSITAPSGRRAVPSSPVDMYRSPKYRRCTRCLLCHFRELADYFRAIAPNPTRPYTQRLPMACMTRPLR